MMEGGKNRNCRAMKKGALFGGLFGSESAAADERWPLASPPPNPSTTTFLFFLIERAREEGKAGGFFIIVKQQQEAASNGWPFYIFAASCLMARRFWVSEVFGMGKRRLRKFYGRFLRGGRGREKSTRSENLKKGSAVTLVGPGRFCCCWRRRTRKSVPSGQPKSWTSRLFCWVNKSHSFIFIQRLLAAA